MLLGARGEGRLGAQVDLTATAERADAALFSEAGGFVLAAAPELLPAIRALLAEHGLAAHDLGWTGGDRLVAGYAGATVLDLSLDSAAAAWLGAVPEAMA